MSYRARKETLALQKSKKSLSRISGFFSLSLVFIAFYSTQAQITKFSGWSAIVNTVKMGNKTQLIMDINVRSSDRWSHIETIILRPGISYSVNAKTALSVGMAFVENRKTLSGVTDLVSDNRLWQQLQIIQAIGNNSLQHRLRMEERRIPQIFAQGNELKKKDAKVNSRLRWFNRYASGFQKNIKLKKGPYWLIQNEFFFNLTGAKYANKKLFDQSRTFAGTGWRFSSKADIELGYMLQHIEGVGKGYTNNHIVQLTSFFRL